ncbi:amidohydrolase [Pectinatus haikarae]|uniref:5-methylthioadenosine/S-adenosylhomocysteine deaminase n=1 Tax=Pectinatus haikarae TaxID=349096 RepID=A0ABT9Y873_9FIRM|nr:amidohydrolase [Pectinatus haikarae]MDQ0203731.1 5-methylthioadenosine/S-adenosylhomocysteine deaminase [Pectinatus haikarae]
MNILIKNVLTVFPNGTAKKTNIAVKNDIIFAIGTIPETFTANTTIDGQGKLAVPGFVNAHTHVSMTLLRSYADDMKLMDWLENKIWPVEAKMKKDDIYWGAMLGITEMIKTGTTVFADMYGDMDKVAQAVEETGIRAVLSRGMIGAAPNGQAALQENCTLFENYNNSADGRITVMFGPHAPYTCPPDFLKQVIEKAQKYNAQIHIHLAETEGEVKECLEKYSKTPIAQMEKIGLLDCGVLAAHCVHLSDEDIAIMKKHNVRVAHNPGSNLKLASGIAPVKKLLEKGICVGLGTDGASSNNNLDMLEEINLTALIHKAATLDPLAVPAFKALQMGTYYGAKAVGLNDTGKIEPGMKADITLFSMQGTQWTPCYDAISLLVYSANASMVDTVIVNGKILLDKGLLTTIDEEKIIYEANKCAERLTGKTIKN